MCEVEQDYLPVTREIGALMEDYREFLEQLDRYIGSINEIEIFKVKKETMKDFAEMLLSLKMGKKPRGLEIQILNELNLGAKSAKEVAEKLKVSEKAIKYHYPNLKQKGLIATKKHVGTELTDEGKKWL